MSGVEAVAWMCTRETTKGGRVFDEPFVAMNRAYVEAHPLHDWSAIYSQHAIDTLRAQLEAAEANFKSRPNKRTHAGWVHRAKHAEARAEAAEAECAGLREDAERYRHLRSNESSGSVDLCICRVEWSYKSGAYRTRYEVLAEERADAAIDQARGKEYAA